MKRLLTAALAALALFALPAAATTTWSIPSSPYRVAKAVTTTGTESAPSGTTEGIALSGLSGVNVYVIASSAMTAGGTLLAYVLDPVTAAWYRDPDLDLTVSALTTQTWGGWQINGGAGRLAYVPSGVGVAVTLYVVGVR